MRRLALRLAPAFAFLLGGCPEGASAPVVELTTAPVSEITATSVTSGGALVDDGGVALTELGLCWGTAPAPTVAGDHTSDAPTVGSFVTPLTGLAPDTVYYLRACATSAADAFYGPETSFRTFRAETVTDVDGNAYATVTIGPQVWLAENLRATSLDDGTPIANLTDNGAWAAAVTPAYCAYDNAALDPADPYGAMYNWYAVATGILCPTGWHVPSEDDWVALDTFLGGVDVSGGKLKETGTSHWQDPNAGASNESSFTGLPGGSRSADTIAPFSARGQFGVYWTSTATSTPSARSVVLGYAGTVVTHADNSPKLAGFSVRCVRD